MDALAKRSMVKRRNDIVDRGIFRGMVFEN